MTPAKPPGEEFFPVGPHRSNLCRAIAALDKVLPEFADVIGHQATLALREAREETWQLRAELQESGVSEVEEDDAFIEVTLKPEVYHHLIGMLIRAAQQNMAEDDDTWARIFVEHLEAKRGGGLH